MEITTETVRSLVAEQLPQWAHLDVRPVPEQGHDNRTFRLGPDLVVRLPSAAGYAAAVQKEDRWLPVLARHVDLAVPEPVATGEPGAAYPWPWSVRRWIGGKVVAGDPPVDRRDLAEALGRFLVQLRSGPTDGAPLAGVHSFYRGCHPSVYGEQVEAALARRPGLDHDACRAIWRDAVTSAWPHAPVWFHGDVAPGNLLVRQGRLTAVIDFGTCGVGDPACDLVVAWTMFSAAERAVFRDAVGLSEEDWARARGWALWKALITEPDSPLHAQQTRALRELLEERGR